jgi:nucleoside 2-deoxyribosyltransferase
VTADWADDPEIRAFLRHAQTDMVPKLRASGIAVSIVPANGEPDPKFCVELGYMIMLDKPIIAVVQPGTKVPDRLVRVADRIVEWTGDHADLSRALMDAIKAMP